jgi:hypothetical protein
VSSATRRHTHCHVSSGSSTHTAANSQPIADATIKRSDQYQMKRDSGRRNNVPDSRGSGSPVKPCSRASAMHSRKLENVRAEALLDPSSPTQRHAHSHATACTVRTGLVMNSHVMNTPSPRKVELCRAASRASMPAVLPRTSARCSAREDRFRY